MSRLTNKYDDGSYGISVFDCYVEMKLGALEDIEENLGIDLITLFKALKDGIYYKDEDYGIVKSDHELAMFYDCLWESNTNRYYFYELYSKTWALDKQTLEK